MKMFQECMTTTLTTVLESKTEKTSGPSDSSQSTKNGETTPVEQKNETSVPPVRMTATCNPMAMHQPHMAITKFTGENWTEFIEYFDSLAEANAWSDKDKLAFLLMSIDSKPRMYARGDKGTPQTYEDVRRRLQQRYGQNEPAFNVRSQLRDIQRQPGERLEVFADRLQEVAQRGQLDPQDRDELFYFAFLNAVGDIPKMQYFIEQAHSKNRSLKLSDLLALAREYLEKSPTARRRSVAVNVCKPISQRKGRLSHDDADVSSEVEGEMRKIDQERKDKKETNLATIRKDVAFLLKESEFHNRCIKLNGLHLNLKEKMKNYKGNLRPRDAPEGYGPGSGDNVGPRAGSTERRYDRTRGREGKPASDKQVAAVKPPDKE